MSYEEGKLVIDEDRLDTSGESSQQKTEFTPAPIDVSTFDECTSEVIEQGVVNFNANKAKSSPELHLETPENFTLLPDPSFSKFDNGPEEENSSDSQNFGYSGTKRTHSDTDLVVESGNEGIKNFLAMKPDPGEIKKKKAKMVDASTNVVTKGSQVDEAHLHLRPGMTTCINITIVYRTGATFYVIAKFKGKEYHGILTDGEAPMAHTYFQKRSTTTSNDKDDHHGIDDQNGEKMHSNASLGSHKHRNSGKRGGRNGAERKNRNDSMSVDDSSKSTDSSHHLKAPKSSKIFEVFSEKTLRRCPHEQCGFRFETVNEMNAHLTWDHVDKKAVMKEEIACQATVETASIAVGTDSGEEPAKKKEKTLCAKCQGVISDRQRQKEDESIKDLIKAGRLSNSHSATNKNGSPAAFSDISDDAPTLEKEAPFETSADGNAESPKKSISEPMLINTSAAPFVEMLNPGPSLVTKTGEEHAKTSDPKKQISPNEPSIVLDRAADVPSSLPSASSPSTPKRAEFLPTTATPQARRTPSQHPPTPNSSNLAVTPTTIQQQIPPNIMASLQGMMAPVNPFALPPGVPFNPAFPAMYNRPTMMPGMATNGLSPVPNQSKTDSVQIRHKLHELKTEPQPSGGGTSGPNVLSTPTRPSTSNSTPANSSTMPMNADMLTQQQAAVLRASVPGSLHQIRAPSMGGMSAFGYAGPPSLSIPQPTPMLAPSPQQVQAQQQAQAAQHQQQQQAVMIQVMQQQFQGMRSMNFLPQSMGPMFPGSIPPELANFLASMNTSSQQNPNYPPK